jgi:hypothetical protein
MLTGRVDWCGRHSQDLEVPEGCGEKRLGLLPQQRHCGGWEEGRKGKQHGNLAFLLPVVPNWTLCRYWAGLNTPASSPASFHPSLLCHTPAASPMCHPTGSPPTSHPGLPLGVTGVVPTGAGCKIGVVTAPFSLPASPGSLFCVLVLSLLGECTP